MRTALLLLALLPFFAAGCGETTVVDKIDYVNAASLETTLADNAVTLIDFTAKW